MAGKSVRDEYWGGVEINLSILDTINLKCLSHTQVEWCSGRGSNKKDGRWIVRSFTKCIENLPCARSDSRSHSKFWRY